MDHGRVLDHVVEGQRLEAEELLAGDRVAHLDLERRLAAQRPKRTVSLQAYADIKGPICVGGSCEGEGSVLVLAGVRIQSINRLLRKREIDLDNLVWGEQPRR